MVAWVAMKLSGMKPDIDIKNKRQYLIGAAIALVLSALIAVIPALCGGSLVGNHENVCCFGSMINVESI